MKLSTYKEYILALTNESENFYIVKDITNGYFRNVILNLKSDIEISLDVKIDYEDEVLISRKTLDKSFIRSASPVSICFKYNGQPVYEEKGYYAVFETCLFGLFVPSNFTSTDSIESDKHSLYSLLNDIILESYGEYATALEIENKKITNEEWSWF